MINFVTDSVVRYNEQQPDRGGIYFLYFPQHFNQFPMVCRKSAQAADKCPADKLTNTIFIWFAKVIRF
jgi:hypothetical protein